MFLNNKLLISLASAGVVGGTAGGIYYSKSQVKTDDKVETQTNKDSNADLNDPPKPNVVENNDDRLDVPGSDAVDPNVVAPKVA